MARRAGAVLVRVLSDLVLVARAGGGLHARTVLAVRPHGLIWYVSLAGLGALAGYGVAMTIVRALGWVRF